MRGRDERRKIEDLLDYFGAFVNTLMEHAELGEIRSEEEKGHTIELRIGDLQTMNFTPPMGVIRTAVILANADVVKYFKGASALAEKIISQLYP